MLAFTTPAAADPIEKLREKIFPAHREEVQCQTLSRGPGVNLTEVDADLQKIVAKIEEHLKKQEEDDFDKLFHPQLRVKSDMGERIFKVLEASYKKPWQFSVYRIWAFNAPEGKKAHALCTQDGVLATTMYGYPLQVGVWFQIMGQDELGRIFVFLAPRQNQWYIVGWHFQQWTQNGKDYEAWAKEGLEASAQKDPYLAHVKFDVAQKLLFGGDFLEFPVKEQIIASRDQNWSKAQLRDEAQKVFKDDQIIYAGTILSGGGVGILVREVVSRRSTTPELQERCLKKGRTLIEQKWLRRGMSGIRCEFNVKGEDPEREGALGGFYYSQADILKKAK